MLIELFDERNTTVTEVVVAATTTAVAAARPHGGDSMQYRKFNNMKPQEFNRVNDPIIDMLMDISTCVRMHIS